MGLPGQAVVLYCCMLSRSYICNTVNKSVYFSTLPWFYGSSYTLMMVPLANIKVCVPYLYLYPHIPQEELEETLDGLTDI